MRITTWNCRRGPLQRKLDALTALEPGVAVLTEAPRPKSLPPRSLWFGAGRLGVIVVSNEDFNITAESDGSGCVHHVAVSGPLDFDLLAVWTWRQPSYLGAFTTGRSLHWAKLKPERLVVAGDFNGGPQFDGPRARKRWKSAFSELNEHGLRSAYHTVRRSDYGAEREPTHWHKGNENNRHHIDYVFVPAPWLTKSPAVSVGSFADWRTLSDHAPVSVDVDLPAPL